MSATESRRPRERWKGRRYRRRDWILVIILAVGGKTRDEARSANKSDTPVASARHQEQKRAITGDNFWLLMQRYNSGCANRMHIEIKQS